MVVAVGASNFAETPTPPAAKPGRGRRFRKGAWAVGDQALISATNFVTMLLVARALTKEDFGVFTLVYAALLQANAMQGALITQPHNVLGAAREADDYARYTTSAAVTQIVVALAAALLALAAATAAHSLGWGFAPVLWALAPAVVGWQLQEFVRRVLYTERRYADAFANDLLGYGGYAVVVVGLHHAGGLTAPRALYALAATAVLATAVGCWRVRGSLSGHFDRAAVRENWDFGKWLAGGAMLRWFASAQMFQYLAAFLLSTAATATLKSAQIILGPTRVLATSLNTVLPTRFARTQAASGNAGLHRELKSTYALVTPVLAAYCLAVAVFAGPLLRLLYPDGKYAGGETVLRLYALSSFLAYNLHFASSALRAGRLTRDIFRISLWTGAAAVVFGCLFITAFGVSGALVGMIATGLVNNVLYWLAYRNHLAREESAEDGDRPEPTSGGAARADAAIA